MILALIIAIVIPIAFLSLVRWLDLYASGSFQVVLLCFGWGIAAFFLAYQVNTLIFEYVGFGLLVTFFAPIVEEILKSLILIYCVRRSDFTYFVDGAIYGFAAGTAFAVLENLLYLSRAEDIGLVIAVSRGFSTSLMHGSASALVGIALGRMRFGRGASRVASLFLGWAAAMALHITYNNIVNSELGALTLLLAVVVGLGGVGLVAVFIFWGLNEERGWLRETLGLQVGVSARESSVVQKLDDLDALLAPVTEHFGAAKRKQVETFVKLQAQLGIKRKARELTPDAALRAELDAQVVALRREMDALRRAVGVYCMAYVRSIFPPETEPLWARLGQTLETRAPSTSRSMWSAINDKMNERRSSSSRKN